MNFLGIGPLELVLLVLIALVVLGPNDIVKVSKNLGNWIRKIRKSDTWDNVIKMTDEVKKIPQNLIEESGIDEPDNDKYQDHGYGYPEFLQPKEPAQILARGTPFVPIFNRVADARAFLVWSRHVNLLA